MTNKTKDILIILIILIVGLWLLSGALYLVFGATNNNDNDITPEQMEEIYEQARQQAEADGYERMRHIANMSDEEYERTFLM